MRRALLLAVLGAAAPVHPSLAQSAPPKKLAASLERVFGPGAVVDSIDGDSALVLRLRRAGALLGYAEVDNVMGKDQPITYLVAVDSSLHLLDVDILVYREPYGGEVAYEPWRRQFRGKQPGETLQVGREIRGISGATISVNAVTAGIRKLLGDLAARRKAGVL
jgi:hypothetical protein